jgi:hypothetical protein
MEIQQISQLFNNNANSLDLGQRTSRTAAAAAADSLNAKKLLLVSPKHSIRSGYSRVAKTIFEEFRKNPRVSVSIYEIITPNLNELVEKIETSTGAPIRPTFDIIFFIIPLFLVANLPLPPPLAGKSQYWLYYKPPAVIIPSADIEFMNTRPFSYIFTPTTHLCSILKNVISTPIKFLEIQPSASHFYPVNKKSARRILNISDKVGENSRIWLAPSANNYESRLDTIIEAFVGGILAKYPNDVLFMLGDPKNADGYPLQDIYLNCLVGKGLSVDKCRGNIIFLDSFQILSGLSDHILNIIYNCSDFVVYANSFSNHSYSLFEIMKAAASTPILLPGHSWFNTLSSMKNPRLYFCEPSQLLYRCGEQRGYDYIIHPNILAELMEKIRGAPLPQPHPLSETSVDLRRANTTFVGDDLNAYFREYLWNSAVCEEITPEDLP